MTKLLFTYYYSNSIQPPILNLCIPSFFYCLFQHYSANILLRYRWNDPRLKQDSFLKFEGGLMMDQIWSPHLYIVNEYEAKVMGSFPKDITMSIWPDGTVIYLTRYHALTL